MLCSDSFCFFSFAAVIFVGSVLLSTSYVDNIMNDELRGTLACSIGAGSCSFCGNNRDERECPEWSETDVSRGERVSSWLHSSSHHVVPDLANASVRFLLRYSHENDAQGECNACSTVHVLFAWCTQVRYHASATHFNVSDRLCLEELDVALFRSTRRNNFFSEES